jgi:twitching motility protein PilT
MPVNTKLSAPEVFSRVVEKNASDLHLTVGLPPTLRINGILKPITEYDVLSNDEIKEIVMEILTDKEFEIFDKDGQYDFSYALENKARFRCNVFYERGNIAVAARLIPLTIPTLEELNIDPLLYEFCKLPQGLVLITGKTGVGKSTTLAALVNWINHNRNAHLITLEDPIEYVFESNKALIQQRELHIDTNSWNDALRSILREDPNIILVGEMRDYESIALTLTAAETGHLVFATLHTNSAAQTIDRIIDVFPPSQQDQIKVQLAAVLEGIISQSLAIGADGNSRYPAMEILISTNAVRNTIREGNIHFIDNIIRTNFDIGMRTLERSLAELVNEGKITLEEAQSKSLLPEEIVRYLKKSK